MIFNYPANKTHFHNKGFALILVLIVRFFGTHAEMAHLITTEFALGAREWVGEAGGGGGRNHGWAYL